MNRRSDGAGRGWGRGRAAPRVWGTLRAPDRPRGRGGRRNRGSGCCTGGGAGRGRRSSG
ncbi:MAG: methyl-CpG-binding protein [Puniceicoccaceae bacterium]|nr:MAG: methyl-CpG-binding protein [Puniceicoccaceae bacterium]